MLRFNVISVANVLEYVPVRMWKQFGTTKTSPATENITIGAVEGSLKGLDRMHFIEMTSIIDWEIGSWRTGY
jgi:hypothetical protein